MEHKNENIEGLNVRKDIQESLIKLADLAEETGQKPLSGILYTVAGVIEGNLDENFAHLCGDYIEAFRKAHKNYTDSVDPKKFN